MEEEVDACPICLEELKNGESEQELVCSHFFHKKCIVEWKKQNSTCPLCRKNIDFATSSLPLTRARCKGLTKKKLPCRNFPCMNNEGFCHLHRKRKIIVRTKRKASTSDLNVDMKNNDNKTENKSLETFERTPESEREIEKEINPTSTQIDILQAESSIDLSTIDVKEQQEILNQFEQEQKQHLYERVNPNLQTIEVLEEQENENKLKNETEKRGEMQTFISNLQNNPISPQENNIPRYCCCVIL